MTPQPDPPGVNLAVSGAGLWIGWLVCYLVVAYALMFILYLLPRRLTDPIGEERVVLACLLWPVSFCVAAVLLTRWFVRTHVRSPWK